MLKLMQMYKLTAVSTFFQSARSKSNSTYMAKDSRYKPSQIDYVLVSSRWATSVMDCKVKWGIACQRWGRRYDNGLVSCLFSSRVKSNRNTEKRLDYSILKSDENIRTLFEESVQAILATQTHNLKEPSASLVHLQKPVLTAANRIPPERQPVPFRKRLVSHRTRELFAKRQTDFQKLDDHERKAASKSISNWCREEYREYTDSVLNDMELAERTGNQRELNRLIPSSVL